MMFESIYELPWPELKIPKYREYEGGGWKLFKNTPPLIRGYYNGLQTMKHDNWVLMKDRALWMSLTPMELESQAQHAAAAYGHTVIMGLGMGVLLYNVLPKPEVTKVTLIEHDKEVLNLLVSVTDFWVWPGIEKLQIVIADALEWKPTGKIDVLLADIWEHLGEEALRPDMQKIHANTNADLVAGWGMELDYITWMMENGYGPGDENIGTYQEYAEDIGLPLIGQTDPDYPELALEAANNVILY